MDDRFSKWLSDSKLPLAPDALEARWQAVEAMGKKISRATLVELLRFYVAPTGTTGVPELLVAAIRKADASFAPDTSHHEIRTLAGVVVRIAAESKSPTLAAAAAYGLITTAFSRANQPHTLSFFANDALKLMSSLAEKRRVHRGEPYEAEDYKPALTEESKAQFVPGLPQAHDVLQKSFSAVAKALTAISDRIRDVDAAERAQREESNVLWWLVTEWSTVAERNVAELSADEGSLVLADELAGLVRLLPAPVAASPVLVRLVRKTMTPGETSIVTCVDSTHRPWREGIAKRPQVDLVKGLCPILTAIDASLSVDGPKEWLPVFKRASGFSGDLGVSHEHVALEFLSELLMVKALGALEGRG